MKKLLTTMLTAVVLAGFVAGSTLQVNAQEKKAASDRKLPFHGKIAEVDKSAKTIVIGKRTFHVTSQTEITKDGKAATIDDAKVGELAGGSYQDSDGKLKLVKVRFGPKPEGEAKGEKPATEAKKSKKNE